MKSKTLLLMTCMFGSLQAAAQSEYTVSLYDSQRARVIPITVYQPKRVNKHTPVVIFNHGYGWNKPNSCEAYSSLLKPLAAEGYYVISIQHELPDDSPLAMTGNFMETRMSNWERGVENIRFVINEFRKLKPGMNWVHLSVIGHSNGGDMTMLFAAKYPEQIHKAISLDHRRMIMPRCSNPQIYTLRGSDYEVDENVIPTAEEQQKHHITVIKLDGIKHSDMDNKGTKEQHETMFRYIRNFLKE